MKKIVKKVLVVLCITFMAFTLCFFLKGKNSKNVQTEDIKVQDKLQTEAELKEELLQKNLKRLSRIREAIDNETEIVLLKEKGHVILAHDKVSEKSKLIDWLSISKIKIRLNYVARLSISSKDIDISLNENAENIEIMLNMEKIKLHSIDIEDSIVSSQKGIIAPNYSPNEVLALTAIGKKQIKEQILKDDSLFFLAEINLRSYVENLAYSLGVINIKIIER